MANTLGEHDPGSAQDWRASSDLWSPANDIFWGILPPFCPSMTNKGSWSLPSKSFFSSTFSNIHLLFLQKGCSAAHESVFFNHPSVQEISQLQFPFPAICNWNRRQRQQHASMDLTSCQREKLLLNSRKDFISVFANAQLVLLSVYPTYPFTFYVNPTKRHVTWSICLSTKEWHFVFSGTQYSRDSSSSWSRSLSSPLSTWGFSCSSR